MRSQSHRRRTSGIRASLAAAPSAPVRAVVLAAGAPGAATADLERAEALLRPRSAMLVGTAGALPSERRGVSCLEETVDLGTGVKVLFAMAVEPALGEGIMAIMWRLDEIGSGPLLREAVQTAMSAIARAPDHVVLIGAHQHATEHPFVVVATRAGLRARFGETSPAALRLFDYVTGLEDLDRPPDWAFVYRGLRRIDLVRDVLAKTEGLSVIQLGEEGRGSWRILAATKR
jgi:hypothetical protein